MKKFFLFAISAFTMIAVGCTTDNLGDDLSGAYKLNASVEDWGAGSRAGFDLNNGGSFFWHNGDAIAVGSGSLAKYTTDCTDGATSATFTGYSAASGYAIYPYAGAQGISGTTLTYEFANEYDYAAVDTDFFSATSAQTPMWATVAGNIVAFKHLGGIFAFKFPNLKAGDNQTFTLTADKKIAGEFTVDLAGAEPVFEATATDVAAEKSVTINFSLGADADAVFYVPVPVGIYDIDIELVNGSNVFTTSYKNLSVSRRDIRFTTLTGHTLQGSEATVVELPSQVTDAMEESESVVVENVAGDETVTIEIPKKDAAEAAETHSLTIAAIDSATETIEIVEAENSGTSISELVISVPSLDDAKKLVVDMPNTTVTIAVDGMGTMTLEEVVAATAENTLVVESGVTIEKLIVKAGNVKVLAGATVQAAERADDNADEVTYIYYEAGANVPTQVGEGIILLGEAEMALREAIAEGGNYALTSDVVLSNPLVINTDFTLSLNGYTISQEKECSGTYAMITNMGSLTIVGEGAITFEDLGAGPAGTSWGTYVIRNQGDLTISLADDAKIEHKGPRQFTSGNGDPIAYVIDNHSAGKVEINSGIISSPKSRTLRNFYTDGNVVINGGVFEGQVWMQQGNATGSGDHSTKIASLTITGGEFSPAGADGSSVFLTNHSADNVKLSVTGGTFNTKIGCNDATKAGVKGAIVGGIFTESAKANTNSNLISQNSMFEANGDGTYTVVTDNTMTVVRSVSEFKTAMANEAIATIVLGDNLTANEILVISRDVTLNGNGYTLTSTMSGTTGRAINVSGANDATIKNLTVKAAGERAINVIQNTKKVTIDNVTATANNYTVNVAGSAAGAQVFIQNSDLTGLNAVNIGAANVNVSINNTTITCNDNSDVESYDAISLNKDAVNSKVMVTGGNIVVKGDSVGAGVTGDNASVSFDGTNGNTTIQYNSFIIDYGNNHYSFTTLEDAIKKAIAGETIQMTRDVTINKTITIAKDKKIVLDMNGHKLNFAVDNDGKASAIFNNLGDLSIVNSAAQESVISFVASDPDLQAIPAYATNTITNEATLYIGKGVTVSNESDGGASYAVDDKGKFVLDGGTLTAKRCALRIAKFNQDDVQFTMNAGSTVKGATPAWVHLPGSNSAVAPKITVVINGGVMQSTKADPDDADVFYTYSFGNSHANTSITINGGEFLGGTVSIGSGYKGDVPSLTINGGTFDHDVVQWLENEQYQVLYQANK